MSAAQSSAVTTASPSMSSEYVDTLGFAVAHVRQCRADRAQ